MTETAIRDILIQKGSEAFHRPAEFVSFTGVHDQDELTKDIERRPHAFVLACLMDSRVKTAVSWAVPHHVAERIGGFGFDALRRLGQPEWEQLMTGPPALHCFPAKMARVAYLGFERIANQYQGDAARIWSGRPSSALVVCRFLEFWGARVKIATMAANILARDLKVPMSDYYSIDISPDVHVRRVFRRLGLIIPDADDTFIIYRARALSPDFPGLLDLPTWEIGRTWCRPSNPDCGACYMNQVCRKCGLDKPDSSSAGASGLAT